jgi:hypothetical protein
MPQSRFGPETKQNIQVGSVPSSSRVTLVLYRRRAFTSVVTGKVVLRRAFDKAVRRKPLAFAADAGLWEFNAGQKLFRILPGCELGMRVKDCGWRWQGNCG